MNVIVPPIVIKRDTYQSLFESVVWYNNIPFVLSTSVMKDRHHAPIRNWIKNHLPSAKIMTIEGYSFGHISVMKGSKEMYAVYYKKGARFHGPHGDRDYFRLITPKR